MRLPGGKDNFDSSLPPPSILSLPYPHVLVRSHELVWAVFSSNSFENELGMNLKYALLMFKIDGLNHYQIKQAAQQLLSTCTVRPLLPQTYHCCTNWRRTKDYHFTTISLSTQKVTRLVAFFRGDSRKK